MARRQQTPRDIVLRQHADTLKSIEIHKRALAALEDRAAKLADEIAALGGVKRRKLRLPHRARGQMRAVFVILRKQDTITSAELAAAMLARLKPPTNDRKAIYVMRQRACGTLRRCEQNGHLQRTGGFGSGSVPKVWRAAR